MSSFPKRGANFSLIISPFLTGVVSFEIQIVPWSIFVGIFASLNSVSIGPGAIPVFLAGTTISILAISPPLAASMILFFARSTFSLNGDMLVNINIHCSDNCSINFSIPGTPTSLRAF